MSNLDDSGLDLEKLFLPAWAQQSVDVNKYADFAGYAEGEKTGGRGGRRRSAPYGERSSRPARDRGGWGGGRSERREGGGPGRERRDRPYGAQQGSEGGRGRGDARRQRSGGGGRRDFRGGRRDAPRRPLPPLPEVDVQLVPESIVVETLAKQIRQSGRAYPLFEIAHIILKRPERLEVAYSVVKKGNQVVQPLFFCAMDRTLWLSEEEAMEHILKNHFDNFYETQKVPIEGPKGTYTFVAQCGMSGEILGPPNLHEYQNKICKIHSDRFSHLPFDVYKSRIRIVRDEEVIEKWREEMSYTLHYNCLQVPEPLELQDMSSLREHFRQTHLASVIQKVETVTLTQSDVRKQPNHLISVLYRRLLEEQKRFPLKLVMVLSQKFAAHTLQFFKVDKTVTHVCVSRPHYLDMETTSVSENVKNIMNFVVANPRCMRADIYKSLVPGYTEAMAALPQEPESAGAAVAPEEAPAAQTAQTDTEAAAPAETPEAPATAAAEKETAPVAPAVPALPDEVLAALANLNADLHWLIQCGHVIEFYKGHIEAAPKKIKPPSPKPKAKKKETKAAAVKTEETKKAESTTTEKSEPAVTEEAPAEAEAKAEETPAEPAAEVSESAVTEEALAEAEPKAEETQNEASSEEPAAEELQ